MDAVSIVCAAVAGAIVFLLISSADARKDLLNSAVALWAVLSLPSDVKEQLALVNRHELAEVLATGFSITGHGLLEKVADNILAIDIGGTRTKFLLHRGGEQVVLPAA